MAPTVHSSINGGERPHALDQQRFPPGAPTKPSKTYVFPWQKSRVFVSENPFFHGLLRAPERNTPTHMVSVEPVESFGPGDNGPRPVLPFFGGAVRCADDRRTEPTGEGGTGGPGASQSGV